MKYIWYSPQKSKYPLFFLQFCNASDLSRLRSEVATRPSGSETTADQINKNASPEGMRSEDMRNRSEDMRNRSEGMDSTEDMRHATEKMRHETEDVMTNDGDPLKKDDFVGRGLEVLQRRWKGLHNRCGVCEACNRTVDCRKCKNCLVSIFHMWLNIGTPRNHLFSIWDKWKIYGFRCSPT